MNDAATPIRVLHVITRLIIGGAQDTGTPQQRGNGDSRWASVSTSDGGDVVAERRLPRLARPIPRLAEEADRPDGSHSASR